MMSEVSAFLERWTENYEDCTIRRWGFWRARKSQLALADVHVSLTALITVTNITQFMHRVQPNKKLISLHLGNKLFHLLFGRFVICLNFISISLQRDVITHFERRDVQTLTEQLFIYLNYWRLLSVI